MADVVERLGDDNIVISTDYPACRLAMAGSGGAASSRSTASRDGSKRKIFWDNSAKLYNLQ